MSYESGISEHREKTTNAGDGWKAVAEAQVLCSVSAVTLIPSGWERCWLVAHSRITRSLVSALEKEPSHLELSHVPTSGSLPMTCQYRVTKALTSDFILKHLQRARHT